MLTYDEKHAIFLRIKNNGTAITRAKTLRKEFTTWKANEVSSAPAKEVGMVGLSNIVDYFLKDYTGAMQSLAGNQFTIEYQLYNDLERVQSMGEATVGVRVPVMWEKSEITANIHPGTVQSISAATWATRLYSSESNRSEISKGTGWNRDECNRVSIATVEALKDCAKVATSGQHKLTRLVKGFSIYLDLAEHGYLDFRKLLKQEDRVELGPENVAREFAEGGSAFVYSSAPTSAPHNAVCYLMASEFPHPDMRNQHVVIPADAQKVKLVTSRGSVDKIDISCRLTADLVLSAICKYAGDFNLQGDMQQAYTIACALNQNKYFTRVSLPGVVSTIDLMPTAIVTLERSAVAPTATSDFANVVGKLFQMSALITAKDMICAVQNTTKEGLDGYQALEMYLTHHNASIERTGAYATAIPMLELCPEMRWLDQLDDGDMEYLNSDVGAFEGLWLCRGAKFGVEHGLLQTMLQGQGDLTEDNKHQRTLVKELSNSEVSIELDDVPTSMFMMEGTCIHANYKRGPRKRKWTKHFGDKTVMSENIKTIERKKPSRRSNMKGSTGYTSNRSSVVSPIRGMKSKRDNVDDRTEGIHEQGSEDVGVRFRPRPIEQVLAEEATGKPVAYAAVVPNIMRDEEKERALDAAANVMDGDDLAYFNQLVDRNPLEFVPTVWNKKDTGEEAQFFLIGMSVANEAPTLDWKLDMQDWAVEHDMGVALAKCDSRQGFVNMIKARKLLYQTNPDCALGDEIQHEKDKIERQEQLAAEEAANLSRIAVNKRAIMAEVEERKRSYSEADMEQRAEEEKSNFAGDPSVLSLRGMRHVVKSKVFNRFVTSLEAGSVVMSKPAPVGLLDWAEATQCSKETMIMLAPYLAKTKTMLGQSPLKFDKVWRRLANVEAPKRRGTSLGKLDYSANDARLAAFYVDIGWKGFPRSVFERINKEYVLDMEKVDELMNSNSSFSTKSGSS